jgi:hypothetical protein
VITINGHEKVKVLVRDHFATWMPIRLELIRQQLAVEDPVDPQSYTMADHLPQNDPQKYPAVLVTSTRTVGMSRRKATGTQELAIFDVDYEVVVVVACEHHEFGDEETAARYRDRMLLAARECVLLPIPLDESTEILQTPLPEEITGAAAETLRGNSLAAGQITFNVRSAETLIPTGSLVAILDGLVNVTPYDASTSTLPTA